MVPPWFPGRPRCCRLLSPQRRSYRIRSRLGKRGNERRGNVCVRSETRRSKNICYAYLSLENRAVAGCSSRNLWKLSVRGARWRDSSRDSVPSNRFEESSARAASSSMKCVHRPAPSTVSLRPSSTEESRALEQRSGTIYRLVICTRKFRVAVYYAKRRELVVLLFYA